MLSFNFKNKAKCTSQRKILLVQPENTYSHGQQNTILQTAITQASMQFEIYMSKTMIATSAGSKQYLLLFMDQNTFLLYFGKRGWKERGMEMGMEKKEGERWQSDGSLMLLGKRSKSTRLNSSHYGLSRMPSSA